MTGEVVLLVDRTIPEWVNEKILSVDQRTELKSSRAIYVRVLRAMNVSPKAVLVGFLLAEHMSERTCTTKVGLRTLSAESGMRRETFLKYANELRDAGFLEYVIGAGTRPTAWTFMFPVEVPARMITARYSAQDSCAQDVELARRNEGLARRNEIASAQEMGSQRAGALAESVWSATDERLEGEDDLPPHELVNDAIRDYVCEHRPDLVAVFDLTVEKFKQKSIAKGWSFASLDAERAALKTWFLNEYAPKTDASVPPVSTIGPVDTKGRPLLDDAHEYCQACDGKGGRMEFDEKVGGARRTTCPTCAGERIVERPNRLDLFDEVAL